MSKQVMHCLGLEVDGPTQCKIRMANDINVRCVGVINALQVKELGTEVVFDDFVGYLIILGRPWLTAMKAKEDWVIGVIKF